MNKNRPIFYAILAALCYGISAPIAKLLQAQLSPASIAAFLYLGAGLGMTVIQVARRGQTREARLVKSDLPYTIAMTMPTTTINMICRCKPSTTTIIFTLPQRTSTCTPPTCTMATTINT